MGEEKGIQKTTVFRTRAILLFSVSAVGELNWGRGILYRAPESLNFGKYNYYTYLADDRVHFIFNRTRTSRELEDGRHQAFRYWESATSIVLHVFDKDGAVERYKLHDNVSKELTFQPKLGACISTNQFIAPNQQRGKRRFVVVELEN